MKDKIFIDTNILIYLVNKDADFHEDVREVFENLQKDCELWISGQVLREYAVIMTRPGFLAKTLTTQELISDIHVFRSLFNVATETERVLNIFSDLVEHYHISGKRIHDVNIVATMMAFSVTRLFTKNTKDFMIFKEIDLL